ncbi:MAG: hypothetical protein AAF333_01950 [Planctomycetota bacterium]
MLRRTLSFTSIMLGITAVVGIVTFPGRQMPLALTMATGWNVEHVQDRIDDLERRAIAGEQFTGEDLEFLKNLYGCGVKLSRATGFAPNTAVLVDRWLDGSGEDVRLDADFVLKSRAVHIEMDRMRQVIEYEYKHYSEPKTRYESFTFYMGEPSDFDALASLYFGKLIARVARGEDGRPVIGWRVEIPWTWPTYDELHEKYGYFHAQNFALPNARSVLMGPRYQLRVDDGLGGHLQAMGVTRPFLVYAEWHDAMQLTVRQRGPGSSSRDTPGCPGTWAQDNTADPRAAESLKCPDEQREHASPPRPGSAGPS